MCIEIYISFGKTRREPSLSEKRKRKKIKEREKKKKSMKRFDTCIPCPRRRNDRGYDIVAFRLERAPRWREPIQTERNSTRNVPESRVSSFVYRAISFPFFSLSTLHIILFSPLSCRRNMQIIVNLHCKFSSFRGMRHVRREFSKPSNLQTPRPS